MARINVYEYPADDDHADEVRCVGHFYDDKATVYHEDTEWDGSNHISVATGSQWDHEALYRTSGGKWVFCTFSNRRGVMPTYRFITDERARDWLLANGHDAAVESLFGPIPEEEDRRSGRPAIGGLVQVRLGDLIGPLDEYAAENGHKFRAEAVRALLGEALAAARPYTVTSLDLSTGLREVDSRHPTLGAAVEALRSAQAADYDAQQNNGLPSHAPRVEHDGRPVDVEAVSLFHPDPGCWGTG